MAENTNKEINQQLQRQKELKKEILSLGERSARLSSDERKHLKELQSEYKTLYSDIKKAQSEQFKGFAEQEEQAKSLGSLYDKLGKMDEERIQKSIRYKSLSDDQQEAIKNIASLNRDLAQTTAEDSIAKQQILLAIESEKAKIGKVHHTQQSIVDNLNQQTDEALKLGNLTETQKTFLQDQLDVYDKIKNTIGGILETASLLWSTTGGKLGAAVMGAGYAMEALGKTTRDFGGYLGGATISATALGTIFPNAAEAAKELSNEMGGLNDVSFQNQLNTNLMATNMGISVGEAAKLTSTLARVTDGSIETAQNLAASTKEFAKQNGVVPSEAIRDMAENSEKFAEYGANSAIELSKAAVQARKLGVDMGTLGKVTDSLLDFESSITNELELSAMLGKNINLNQARALAYEGKMGDAVKETIKQLGGRDAFNKMDIFQKREAAKTLGISVDELSKMANNMDKLNSDGTFQKTTFESWSESLTAFSTGPLGNILKTFGSLLIAAGQMTPFLSSMGINLGGMAKSTFQVLKNMGGMVIEAGKWVAMKVFNPGLLTAFGDKLKGIGNTISSGPIGKFMGGLKDRLLKGVGGGTPTAPTTPTTPPVSSPDAGGSTSKLADSISKIKMNDVVKGAAALVLIAGAMWVLGKALQEFQGIGWDTLAVAGVALLGLTLALAGVGAIMMSGVGAVAILAGAAAMLVIAASLYVLGKALQEISIGFQAMGMIQPILSGLVSMVGGIFLLAGAFGTLAASLAVLAVAGIAALPALLGLAAVGAGMGMLFNVLGIGDDETSSGGGATTESLSEYESSMLSKMDALIVEVGKSRDVYLDRDKVTAVVSRTTERSPKNVFGVNNA